jgi:Putative DNA-binding domain
MIGNPYKTLDDIRAIITEDIPEGVGLEYKGSNILVAKDIKALCKTVTALANSIGGQFVTGIESQGAKPVRLDGGVAGPSRVDWIHKIINTSTFPAVESVEILELTESTGSYYVINVAASVQAPHQSNDRRYYKRRGSHSEPMEHYEIEDVRNRPKRPLAPLRVELFTQEILAFLYFKNEHRSDSLRNVKCRIESNFELERNGIQSLASRGLRELRAQTERFFLLDTVPMMLSKNPEAELRVSLTYEFQEAVTQDSVSFYLADLMDSAIIRSPVVNAIKDLGEKVEKTCNQLERLRRDTEALARIADGTGLRLSQRTLRALKNSAQLFDPREFDWDGYKIVLEISDEEAIALQRIFGVINMREDRRRRYGELAPELRAKFENCFRVELD